MAANKKPLILIAEDDEVNRDIIKEILKDGYEILEAANGQEAIDIIDAKRGLLGLVLMDIHMPVVDGFEAIEHIHANGLAERIPVIITTVDRSADVLLLGKKYKVSDIIYKPFSAKDIRNAVDTLFELLKCEQRVEDIVAEKSEYFVNQYEALKKAQGIRNYLWEDNVRMTMDLLLPKGVAHRRRIMNYTGVMLERLSDHYPKYRLASDDVLMITKCTLMHDIGSVVIPDLLLEQQGETTSYRGLMQIRKRPIVGSELINLIFANSIHQQERKHCHDICRYMRERYDGKGYPDGMVGEEIPLSAQVVGLVHRYDELRFMNGRMHSHKTTCNMILEAEYNAFNPDLIDIFEDLTDRFEDISKSSVK